eukprot:Pompholyxophrys_punicea_v1_NODE_297_length_2335_cov_6.717544.p1 type:complete len:120 gc:universal NODE_297_length_2335_cov_6.717544:497-138(-)
MTCPLYCPQQPATVQLYIHRVISIVIGQKNRHVTPLDKSTDCVTSIPGVRAHQIWTTISARHCSVLLITTQCHHSSLLFVTTQCCPALLSAHHYSVLPITQHCLSSDGHWIVMIGSSGQ